jgi:ATP-dependent RNA helicase DeaD
MTSLDSADLLEPELRECLRRRGFESLTPVQTKVLEPDVRERDLRVTSQTGSGKTVAIGLLLRHGFLTPMDPAKKTRGTARALIVVPTRELAKQVHQELSWLYQPLGLRLACATGGANYGEERRALGMKPSVVIGTPGRLIDHIERGALEMDAVESIVLDEADRMLDMGFTESIESIFSAAPNRKYTHLVSATLEPEVLRLANRYQSRPLHIEGTRYGEAHADIEHRVHLVEPKHRLNALVNLLLMSPEERTLVFARTRADVGSIAEDLQTAGFRVGALSGDMEQPARDRALAAFKHGKITTLVATDVAARGIDVQSMTRVIQVDPATDPESYTHRSGRTGRAGQKGTSIVLLAPSMQRRFRVLLAQARVTAKFLPLPSPEAVRAATDERTLRNLTETVSRGENTDRLRELATRLLSEQDPVAVVATLIAKSSEREPEPREVPVIYPEAPEKKGRKAALTEGRGRESRPFGGRERSWDSETPRGRAPFDGAKRDFPEPRATAKPVSSYGKTDTWSNDSAENWGMFRVTWGNLQGADPRRMLAVLCRRGGIRGTDVGAIRIGPTATIVEVKGSVAAEFASRALTPDPQEPKIRITPISDGDKSSTEKPKEPFAARAKGFGKKHFGNQAGFSIPKKVKKFGRASA